MLLLGATKHFCTRKKDSIKASSVLRKRTDEDILESSPVKIKFGRPDFVDLISKNINK